MGRDKAFLTLGGRTFVRIAADLLEEFCAEVMLIGGSGSLFSGEGFVHHSDRLPGLGPLGGLLTAFDVTVSRTLIILPCDLPLLERDMIQTLAEADMDRGDIALIATAGGTQPLVGRYNRSIHPVLRSYVSEGGRSVKGFLDHCSVQHVEIHRDSAADMSEVFRNVNTPSEYEDVRTRSGEVILKNEIHHERSTGRY